ncbi:MAG TPA: type II toxin-antitoxin system RatA family toxin [Alphaproteobacteria bacterium]|nr:type II toxin-antitoxin system RatA family toxin [Alphaproteobacteria bacterium]
MHRHAETRTVPYSPKQMFELISDIGRYPEFLPYCLAARVTGREDGVLWADLVVGKGPFRESFTSKVKLEEGGNGAPPRIDVDYVKGPMRKMDNHWVFREADGGGTEIDFNVQFEFKSRMLERVMAGFFDQLVRSMVGAFERRAHAIYGSGGGG